MDVNRVVLHYCWVCICLLSLFTICLCVIHVVLLAILLLHVMIVSPLYEGWSLLFYLVTDLLSCQLIRLWMSWRPAATARQVLFLSLRQYGSAR